MDLRGNLTPAQIDRACSVLDYQPFIITDDVQTGAAYSWVYNVNLTAPTLLFDRRRLSAEEWSRIDDANARLRRMYDAFVLEIAMRFHGGTVLDFACNNGYFPIMAEICGMRGVGADTGVHFQHSVNLLNEVFGTRAQFVPATYDPRLHLSNIGRRYTVVLACAIMCHLPDPLNFLTYLGSLATDAIFFFGQVVDTEAMIISYLPRHPDLGLNEMPFPYRFNRNTRLSRGLLYHGLEEMGFKKIVELPWSEDWLPPYFDRHQGPRLEGDARDEVQQAWRLRDELQRGSTSIALIASR